ncbi:MAG: inositol monophosphatase family protein, partial [Candidatus Hydrogenedentota bacterium]
MGSEAAFIESILREVSPYVRERYAERRSIAVSSKTGPNDLLTEVDSEVQRRIVSAITRAYPGDCIVAEEDGMNHAPGDLNARCWIIDPIDGTQNFVRGLFPMFGVSIAFAEKRLVRAGGVMMPVVDDLFLAEHGAGARRNGAALWASKRTDLATARVEIDFGNPTIRRDSLDRFSGFIEHAGEVRTVCAAVVGLCSVAAGEADGYVNVGLSEWDYAAAALIVEEAGGAVSRLDGSPVVLFDGRRGMLATNTLL